MKTKKTKRAVAILYPDKHFSKNNKVKGIVRFTQKKNNLYINYNIENLPKGYHGFHIHEYGDLSEGCKTAGPHFTTYKKNIHGGPTRSQKHNGDLGNIYNKKRTRAAPKKYRQTF
jgi:Cu/Zn superoxide dismutase